MKKILNFLKPEWISQTWREGSMGNAEKKETWRYVSIGTAILVLVLSLQWFGLFDTYFAAYWNRAGFVAHLFSVIFGLGSIYALWKAPDFILGEKSGWVVGAVILGLLALSIIVGAGFNFDLHGIEPDSMNQFNPDASPAQPN